MWRPHMHPQWPLRSIYIENTIKALQVVVVVVGWGGGVASRGSRYGRRQGPGPVDRWPFLPSPSGGN